MKKILIPMLLMTGSIIKATTASTKDADLTIQSKYIMAFIRAGGVRSDRIDAWVEALRLSNAKAGFAIKTYVASERHSRGILVGADAIELRKAVENNTHPIKGDIVMANFLMEGYADSVTVDSDIHTIDVIQSPDEKDWLELKASMPDTTSGSYTQADSCTKCFYQWKAVIEEEKMRVVYHKEVLCKSNFPKEVFFAEITQDQA
jgi:hypothetical protein